MADRKPRGTSPDKAREIADRYFDLDSGSTEPPAAEEPGLSDLDGFGGTLPRRRRAKVEKPPKAPDPPVTDKQARFIEEYPVDFNGTAAAIRAGYSERTAAQQSYENLRKPHISRAIEQRIKHLAQKAGWDATRVLAELGQRLMADENDIRDENGQFLPFDEWPELWRRGMVTGFKARQITDEDSDQTVVITEVKFLDRTRLLELIGKHRLVQAWNHKHEDDPKRRTNPLEELARQLNGTGLKPKEIEGTARPVPDGN